MGAGWVLPKIVLRREAMALFCFGRFPQWVRFFEWPGSGAERCVFHLGGESPRPAALIQVSFGWVRSVTPGSI